MRRTTPIAVLGMLLLGVTAATAQPDVPIKAPAPIERPEKATRPGNAGDESLRGSRYAPAFIGPTAKGDTTEGGFSGWIAPDVPSIAVQPGGGNGGWASFGFTFTWGGAPRRPGSKSTPSALAPSAPPASAVR